VPVASAEVVQLALPEASATGAQPVMGVVPSRKVTLPVAVPLDPVTETVSEIAWPVTDGLSEEARATAGVTFSMLTVRLVAADAFAL